MAILLVRSVGPSRAYYIAPPFRRSTVRNSVVLLASKDGFEYNDEESYRTRYVGDSDEARELRNMRYEEDMSDTSIVVDNDDYYDEDEEYMDDDDDDDMYMGLRGDDKEVVGNFWSNPKPGFDLLPTDRSTTYSRQETSGERPKRRQRPRGARKPKYVLEMRIDGFRYLCTLSPCITVELQNDFSIGTTKNTRKDCRLLRPVVLVWFQSRREYCPWRQDCFWRYERKV